MALNLVKFMLYAENFSTKSFMNALMKDYSAVRVFVASSPSSVCLISTSSTSQNGTLKMAVFLTGALLAATAMALLMSSS